MTSRRLVPGHLQVLFRAFLRSVETHSDSLHSLGPLSVAQTEGNKLVRGYRFPSSRQDEKRGEFLTLLLVIDFKLFLWKEIYFVKYIYCSFDTRMNELVSNPSPCTDVLRIFC